ncbi:hypothetical protein DL96DRAFT_1636321, partial [Flagelloscypha sp. PMI_526]
MLSQDLIRPIIMYLEPRKDSDSLRSCCLVASSFLRKAQPHLFSWVQLWSGIDKPDSGYPIVHFRKLLDKSPHIASWVRRVRMHAPSCTDDERIVFESLSSLRSLSFFGLGKYWSKIPLKTRHVLQSQILPRLDHLSVDLLVPGIISWNHLPSLWIAPISYERWGWNEPLPDSEKLKVDHLKLTGNVFFQFDTDRTPDCRFVHWKFLDLKSLKSIHLNTYNHAHNVEYTLSCYRALLLGAQMNLTSLVWDANTLTDDNWNRFNGTYDLLQLTFLPVLENLTFEFAACDENDREPCLQWLADHFQLSSSHPLKTLSLNFDEIRSEGRRGEWRPDWQHSAWTNLDTTLQQEELFQFRSLMIGVNLLPLYEEFCVSVGKALPVSHSKGLVGLRQFKS